MPDPTPPDIAAALADLRRSRPGTMMFTTTVALNDAKPPLVQKDPSGTWSFYEHPYQRASGVGLVDVIVLALLVKWGQVTWIDTPAGQDPVLNRQRVARIMDDAWEQAAAELGRLAERADA